MKDNIEAKVAWVLWELFTDLNNQLWDRYQDQFLEFLLKEQYPIKKDHKPKEQLIHPEIDDEVAF